MEESKISLKCNNCNISCKNNKNNINNSSSSSTPTHKPTKNLSNFKIYQAKQIAKGLSAPMQPSKSRWTKQHVPVPANADSGATGNYLTLTDIEVLRDVKISEPNEQISVAVANGMLLQSTHHGFLDILGHSVMIAHIFPQLKGCVTISQCRTKGYILCQLRNRFQSTKRSRVPRKP